MKARLTRSNIICAGLLVALVATQILTLALATAQGVVVSPDSVTYLKAARSLSEGKGLRISYEADKTLKMFPPLYPVLLAVGMRVVASDVIAARWLQILLFTATCLLVFFVVKWLTHSRPLSLWAAAIFATSLDTVMNHAAALSEALFTLLLLLGLWSLIAHLSTHRLVLLMISAVSFGLAALTRYAGLGFMGSAFIILLVIPYERLKTRVAVAFLFLTVGLLPLALFLHATLVPGEVGGRHFVWHPMTSQLLVEGLVSVSNWILPHNLPFSLRGTLFLAALSGLVWLSFRRANSGRMPWVFPRVVLILGVGYVAFVMFATSGFGSQSGLSGRIMYPLYVLGVLYAAVALGTYFSGMRRFKSVTAVLVVLMCGSLSFNAYRDAVWTNFMQRSGDGYLSPKWRQSPTLHALPSTASGATIWTNAPEAVWLLSGRNVAELPSRKSPLSGLENARLTEDLAGMEKRLIAENGVVAFFDNVERNYLVSEAEVVKRLSLIVLQRTKDGTVYRRGGLSQGVSRPVGTAGGG